MKVKSLKPPYEPLNIQCSATIDLEQYSPSYLILRAERCAKLGWNPKQCTHAAVIDYNGVMLCKPHAGQLALAGVMNCDQPEWAGSRV